jgi:hypothetical protein
MKNFSKMQIIATIFIALLLGLPLGAALQEKTAEKSAPPAKPGVAEMERLKFYLGEWDYTETYPKSAFSPDGGKTPACTPASSGRAGIP